MAKPTTHESTVVDALEIVSSALEELHDEMTSWRDNLDSANMSHLPKFDAVSECADALETADIPRRVETLLSDLDLCAEGRAFRAGCPEHLPGAQCNRCGWNGSTHQYAMPVLQEHSLVSRWVEWQKGHVTDVASMGNCTWQVRGECPDPDEVATALRRARAEWWSQAERIVKLNEIPARLADEPEEGPILGAEALDAPLKYQTSTKRRQSRADRLGEAQEIGTVALAALDDALESIATEGLSALNQERLDDVRHGIAELREGLDELSGVEFPGMFG